MYGTSERGRILAAMPFEAGPGERGNTGVAVDSEQGLKAALGTGGAGRAARAARTTDEAPWLSPG